MKILKNLTSFVRKEFTDEETVVLNMTKYDMFVFLYSFFFTLEVGMMLIFKTA